MSRTRTTTLPFLLLKLSSFIIFDSGHASISCPLCKSNTLLNIFIILGRNVEHFKTLHYLVRGLPAVQPLHGLTAVQSLHRLTVALPCQGDTAALSCHGFTAA